MQVFDAKTSHLNQLYQGSFWAPPSVEYKQEGVASAAILEKREDGNDNKGAF